MIIKSHTLTFNSYISQNFFLTSFICSGRLAVGVGKHLFHASGVIPDNDDFNDFSKTLSRSGDRIRLCTVMGASDSSGMVLVGILADGGGGGGGISSAFVRSLSTERPVVRVIASG